MRIWKAKQAAAGIGSKTETAPKSEPVKQEPIAPKLEPVKPRTPTPVKPPTPPAVKLPSPPPVKPPSPPPVKPPRLCLCDRKQPLEN
jgi:hypothetical protein